MRSFILAAGFLTVLPMGKNITASESDIGRSLGWFPLVGMLIGAISVGVCWLLHTMGLNLAADVLAVLTPVFLTGGLHWDGLMDTADGILSYRDREKMLAIMKDSTVGAMGVLAAICILLLKIALVVEIPLPEKLYCLGILPVISRMCMVFSIVKFPYAREKGIGGIFAYHAGNKQLALAAAVTAAAIGLIWPWPGFLLVLWGLLFSVIFSSWVCRRLGGLTGDVYGAVTEITEAAVLMVVALAWKIL
ncbi:MAG: adenosylcobinamide-GDP ribazoletransferase [Desulfotomaculum sp.]|nr:adenosylcobinamide-GDP ribazoletransferase [Desulfotomaculum sp.]